MSTNGLLTKQQILFFTPYYKENRGNATTAKRIVEGLSKTCDVSVFAYEEDKWSKNWQELFDQADLYHILHLRRFASWQTLHKLELTKPYVLTSGGTDINEDLNDPAAVQLMKSVADESCAITVFSHDGKSKITTTFPELAERVHVIPQSIWLPQQTNKATKITLCGYPRFLLPAGLRPVKDVFYLWEAFEQLRIKWSTLTFSIIGAKLDEDVSKEVVSRAKEVEWFHYLGEVPLEEMAEVYNQCDIVLNTSISEGQPTSLLEAMFMGKPVVARRNPGNESIINHGQNGLIFATPQQFIEEIEGLLCSEKKRNNLIKSGQVYTKSHHQLDEEILKYLTVYSDCIEKAIQHKTQQLK